MKRLLQSALVLLPCALLPAQDATEAAEAKAQLQELQAEFDAALGETWMAAYQAAAEAEDEAKMQELVDLRDRTTKQFAQRYFAASQIFGGTEHAVPFLVWVCNNDPSSPQARYALGTLIEDHVEASEIASVVSMIPSIDRENGREFLDRLIEKAEDDRVREEALFTRAETIVSGDATDAERQAAIADFRKIVEMTSNASMKTRAEGAIFAVENLAVGMLAPEIEAEDLDGVTFKLSDYRGKVVMLDFWGDW